MGQYAQMGSFQSSIDEDELVEISLQLSLLHISEADSDLVDRARLVWLYYTSCAWVALKARFFQTGLVQTYFSNYTNFLETPDFWKIATNNIFFQYRKEVVIRLHISSSNRKLDRFEPSDDLFSLVFTIS